MLEPIIIYIIDHWDSIKRILLYSIPLIVIFGYLLANLMKGHISKNWKDYKTNPFFLFFGGFFNKYPNETALQATERNFTEYLSTFIKEVYNFLMIPVYSIFNIFHELTKSVYTIINKIRGQMAIMRNFLMKIVSAIFDKITNGVAVSTYMFMKIRDGLRKQFGLFNLVSSTVEHSYYFIYSLLGGPLGDMGRYGEEAGLAVAGFTLGAPGIGLYLDTLCFSPETLIDLPNSKKEIRQIKPGETLIDNNIVLGTVNIASKKQVDLYQYNGVLVTGDHLVYNKNWKRVNQLTNRGFTQAYPKLNCLITSSGTMSINGELWRDYTDNNNESINNFIQTKLLEKLNKEKLKFLINHINEMVWGFHPDTIIYNRKISSFKPGEIIDGREVKAIITIAKNTMNTYKIKNKNIITSGNVIINDGKWNKVFNSELANSLNQTNNEVFYNIVIDGSIIEIDGLLFRDYLGIDDKCFNNEIDIIMENSLNYSPI